MKKNKEGTLGHIPGGDTFRLCGGYRKIHFSITEMGLAFMLFGPKTV